MKSSPKTDGRFRRIIAYVVLILLVIISLLPFYLLFINATRPKTQSGIRWYPDNALAGNWRKLFAGTTRVAFGNVYKALLSTQRLGTALDPDVADGNVQKVDKKRNVIVEKLQDDEDE